MKGLRIMVAVVAVLVAAVTLSQLLHKQDRVAGTNGLGTGGFVGTVPADGGRICQDGDALPADARSIQLLIGTAGQQTPDIDVVARAGEGGRVLARGHVDGGWVEGTLRIPLSTPPVKTAIGGIRLCVQTPGPAPLSLAGAASGAPAVVKGKAQPGRIGYTFFREPESLLASAGDVMRRYARGNAGWMGPWTAVLILLIALGAVGCAAMTILAARRTELAQDVMSGTRSPAWTRWCAMAGLLAGLSFALLTPPMQVPDEQSNLAYTMFLAHGQLPLETDATPYTDQERFLLDGLGYQAVKGNPYAKPPWTAAQEATLRVSEDRPYSRSPDPNASSSSANPPLYYALTAVPYRLTPGSLLDRILPMRLLSVLLGALTVLAAALFTRELLPRSP